MKKIISMLTTAALMCTTAVFAAENQDGDKVEISFKIGDSVLNINGNPVEVEKPFIAGDGVTMVPLRVINEAFGAEVIWDGEKRTITINYPGVKLGFTVDSKKVTVNDHTETLEEAPVVLGEGTTMVPFRFISETFGATVEWDQATGGITVTKYSEEDETSTVQGAIEKDNITDSYYKWSMENPKSMQVESMSFDRRRIKFSNSEGDNLLLAISYIKDDGEFSIDKVLSNMKVSFGSLGTISKSEKRKNADGDEFIEVLAHDDDDNVAAVLFIRDNIAFEFTILTDIDRKSEYEELVRIVENFRTSAMNTDSAEDISNIENGYRLLTDEEKGISYKVPEGWASNDSTNNDTSMFLSVDTDSYISDYIFSKTETETAKSSAEADRERHINDLNKEVSTVSEVQTKTIDGYTVYYYTATVSGTKYDDLTIYDAFIENGDYINNFTLEIDADENINAEEIINSIKITDIDSEEIGNIVRTQFSDDLLLDYSLDKIKLKIPESWNVIKDSETLLAIDYTSEDRVFSVAEMDLGTSVPSTDIARQLYSKLMSDSGYTGVMSPTGVYINGISYVKFAFTDDNGEFRTNGVVYIRSVGNNVYQFMCTCSDEYDIDTLASEMETIIENAEWE